MRTLLPLCFLTVISSLLISCSKEILKNDDQPLNNKSTSTFIVGDSSDTNLKVTRLGAMRDNPYTVSNMIAAWNNTYKGAPISEMEPTNLYVKFSPNDEEHMFLLEETDEMLYDFPLEYEVLEMGDYYNQPGKTTEDYPDLYAVVPADFAFPSVPYTIEADLVIPNYMSYLVGEAFRLTNNPHPLAGVQPSSINNGPCEPGCPDFPCCLDSPSLNPQCGDCIKDPCVPGSPDYPDCKITTGPITKINDCGCAVSSDNHHPGGCVGVDDVELNSTEPVRKVKVIVKDNWFTEDETYTDEQGCWSITDRRYHGRAWVWTKFKNNDSRIRGTYHNWRTIWNWTISIKDYVGAIHNAPFNEVDIRYTTGANSSQAHRYWSAATVNNAVQEFNDFAQQDLINAAPYVDIYVNNSSRGGAAIMTHQLGLGNYTYAVNSGLWGWIDAGFVGTYMWSKLTASSVARSYFVAPDLIIGTDFTNSDRLKRLAFHEIAHASHYALVQHLYWMDLMIAEMTADGHGDQFSNDADLISVAESWAEYLAMSYTHRVYGATNSYRFGNSWEDGLELIRNENLNHIPVGLPYDLLDPVGNENRAEDEHDRLNSFGPITDQVVGFTNQQMFQSLNNSVRSPDQFRQWLNAHYTVNSGNAVSDVDDLFQDY